MGNIQDWRLCLDLSTGLAARLAADIHMPAPYCLARATPRKPKPFGDEPVKSRPHGIEKPIVALQNIGGLRKSTCATPPAGVRDEVAGSFSIMPEFADLR